MAEPSVQTVTITQPHHPYYGQDTVVLRTPMDPGTGGEFVVRFSDGSCSRIPLTGTNQVLQMAESGSSPPASVLALTGLRKIVQHLQLLGEKPP